MPAKANKALFSVIVFAVVLFILLVVPVNFRGGSRESYPAYPPGTWDGDLCSKILRKAADDEGHDEVTSDEDRLRDVVEVDVANGSIFFLETSCTKDLTPRQACAVESAARNNPETQVYVLVTSPLYSVGHDGKSRYARLLSAAYPNVHMHLLQLRTYSRETPMEGWVNNGSLTGSGWIVHHASDALRLLTLWRYGGTYLDLDVVLMRPLAGMRNFAGAEGGEYIANGVINLEGSGGHALADAFAREFVSNYRGGEWSYNGPGVLTRVLGRVCNGGSAGGKGGWTGCPHGFRVYPPSEFYPIPWWEWTKYFNESTSEATMSAIGGSTAAHVWNKLSSGTEVKVGSSQPYGLLAGRHCPVVYDSCGKTF